ncbi:sensor histidine kinase [Amycolatopsis halotolerans]|uniref:histidine kinase n=1 Tax=Amycolatopsis halotolerans TaxID=330083 RepID=A0ABV7QTN3_9PSEU
MTPLRVSDVALAAGLLVTDVGLAGNVLIDEEPWRLPVSAVIATLIAAAVLLRRRAPVPILIGTTVVSASAAAFGLLWDPFVGAALVLYLVRPPRALPAAAGVAAMSAATAVVGEWWYAFGVPLALLTWGLAEALRSRRAQTARQERQREHRILVDERVRIARELHDVVTHGMGLIAVKAGVANHVADSRPEEARDALRVIEATSRAALGEMRRLLHVLRDDGDETPADPLAALPELAERARQAGVDVELSVLGTARVPEPVALAAYRIVQEAVTNVVKHAAPARCRVVVAVAAEGIRIQVTDDGAAPIGELRLGHGLTGMRERVALYSGELVAGPGPDGGFRVAATLRCADA